MEGAYNCTFNMRSEYIYKTKMFSEGFFLRKACWKDLIQKHDLVNYGYLDKIKHEYEEIIQPRMERQKLVIIKRLEKREDIQYIWSKSKIKRKNIVEEEK